MIDQVHGGLLGVTPMDTHSLQFCTAFLIGMKVFGGLSSIPFLRFFIVPFS
jgi:hypothetical protein